MRWAMENHRLIYKHTQKLKGNGKHRDKRMPGMDEPLRLLTDPYHPDNRGFDSPTGAE